MARIRSIHPGIWTDEAFVQMTMPARLFLIGIWGEADDCGLFEWRPVRLKMRIAPADVIDAAEVMAELAAAGFIVPFSRGGKEFGAVKNFRKFQRPKNPSAPILPLDNELRAIVGLPIEPGPTPDLPQAEPPPSEISPQMEDGGGEMEEEEDASASSAREPVDDPVVRTKKRIMAAWQRLNQDPNRIAIDTGVVNVWAAQGLDMSICEAVVISGLERDLPKGKAIRSLKWFEGAITEAHDKRSTVKIAPPPPPPKARDPSTVTDRKWVQMVTYFRDTGTWSEAVYGPAPGLTGCRAPPDILAQHGYGAAA